MSWDLWCCVPCDACLCSLIYYHDTRHFQVEDHLRKKNEVEWNEKVCISPAEFLVAGEVYNAVIRPTPQGLEKKSLKTLGSQQKEL